MLRLKRSCKIGPTVLLALFLSLVNTLVILMYLGPLSFKNEDTNALTSVRMSSVEASRSNIKTSLKNNTPQKIERISVVNQEEKPKLSIDHSTKEKNGSHSFGKVDVFTMWSENMPNLQQPEYLDHASRQLHFDRNAVLMLGKSPVKPVDIVIGIPTVKRDTTDYLSFTIRHLVKYLNKNETKQCHIVVFSANFEQAANDHTANFIKKEFAKEVGAGLIEVIKPDLSFYPKLTGLPVLWKDKPDRIKWRSKQCLDYALLFAYCRKLGRYYLQLEDDVSVSQTYFKDIKYFIRSRGLTKWSNLQFGTSGFIGMLFRTADLGRLALFVKMYYWIFPVDILFRHYNDIHLYGNSPADIYRPPLFQHLGHESSLKGQTRKIQEVFKNAKVRINKRKYTDSTNPSAFVSTNIQVFESNTIDGPYRISNLGYFWGKDVHLNDFVIIDFMKQLTLFRVVIETGSVFAANDCLAEGKLEFAMSKYGNCDVGGFKNLSSSTSHGMVEARVGSIPNVKCIKLSVSKLNLDNAGNSRWLLIREIAVWSR